MKHMGQDERNRIEFMIGSVSGKVLFTFMVRNRLPLAFIRDAKTSQTFTHIERFHLDLRRILQKGVSFNPLSQEQVNLIMSHLNSYPRPSLGGRTPHDLFVEEFGDEGKRFLDKLGIVRIPQGQVTLHPFLLGRKFQKAADKAVPRKNGVLEAKNTER